MFYCFVLFPFPVAKIIVFFIVGMLLGGSVLAHKERDTIGVGERIRFIENKTQWEQHIRYKVAMANNTVFFHNDGYTVFLSDPKNQAIIKKLIGGG